MFKYFQVGERTTWEVIEDGPDVEQRAIEKGAKKVTMLAVSLIITEETDRSDINYKGDIGFDVDNKEDLDAAIKATRDLVNKLRNLGVPEEYLKIYASGSKGFHIIVPASIFSTGRPLKDLPYIYKEMALELYVIGLDFQVYSGGKGVSWRLPNIQREDGRYRVPITSDELFTMTADQYVQYTSTPRIVPAVDLDPSFKAIGMEDLMERAKRRVRARPQHADPVADDDLAELAEDPPPCISELADYKTKPSKNFNEIAFQLGTFIARSGMQDTQADSLMSRLATNGTSSQYNSVMRRLEHAKGLISYLRMSPSKKFICNPVRAVLASRPCQECNLCRQGDAETDPGEEVGMVERLDGYYVLGANGERRVSTFILVPEDVYYEESQSGHEIRRVGTRMEVQREGEAHGRVMFREAGWTGKSSFKGELTGISNIAFFGTEDDVQRIKHIVFDEGREMGEIIQVYSAGMHRYKVGHNDVMVYVEPGMSINQYRVRGTHLLGGKINSPPNVKSATIPEPGETNTADVMRNLMQVNEPDVTAQVLGWYSLCHLKLHLMKMYSQFPLLSLWGNAGAGKTMTAVLFSGLNGCDPTSEDGSLSMAGITPFAITNFCSSTTTIPRILEEYNKSKLTKYHYDKCGEVMKMGWNGQIVAKGTLKKSSANGTGRSGAEVAEYPITSPMVITSEQAPQMPALKQRSVQVQMNPASIRTRNDPFFHVQRNSNELIRIAKTMVIVALNTTEDWIRERLEVNDEYLPNNLIDRPRYSYATLGLGLDFLERVTEDELKLGLGDHINDLRTALFDSVHGRSSDLHREKMRTEVDIVMDDIGMMAQMSLNNTANWLKAGTHYKVQDNQLYFDVPVLYATYKSFKMKHNEPLIIEDVHLFRQLIQTEPYFVTDQSVDGSRLLSINRVAMQLDMTKMQEKGLDTSLYG